jgi:hypothetical protein
MEKVCSYETPVHFYQTEGCHTPKDSILHSHYLEDLKDNNPKSWICCLFNDAVSSSGYLVSNGGISGKCVEGGCRSLSRYLPEGTEETHENHHS